MGVEAQVVYSVKAVWQVERLLRFVQFPTDPDKTIYIPQIELSIVLYIANLMGSSLKLIRVNYLIT